MHMKNDPDTKADVLAAITEAVEDKGTAWLAEPDDAPQSTPDAAPGEGEPSREKPSETVAAEAEPTVDTVAEQPDKPTNPFLATLLESIPPEAHDAVIERFEQQEGYIHKLQADLADARSKEPEPKAPEDLTEPEYIPDDQLLIAAGYDPEDYEVQQQAKFLLPSLRRELALEDQLAALAARDQARETQSAFETQLQALEGQYGPMPGDRESQRAYALENGISSPKELYFDLTMPVRREVDDIVRRARTEAAKRAESAGTKPRTSNAGADPVTKDMTLREAVAAAAKSAEEETGRSWKGIFKGRSQDA